MRNRIVTEARSWLGVRWRHQGRTRHGVDCAGLVVNVGKALGAVDYDATDYQRRTNGREFLRHFRAAGGVEIRFADAAPGDVLVFRDDLYPCHSTILAERHGQPSIIHACARRRKVIEEVLSPAWIDRLVGCFRYPGVVDE